MNKYLKYVLKRRSEEIDDIIENFCSENEVEPSEFIEILKSRIDSDEYAYKGPSIILAYSPCIAHAPVIRSFNDRMVLDRKDFEAATVERTRNILYGWTTKNMSKLFKKMLINNIHEVALHMNEAFNSLENVFDSIIEEAFE